MGSSSESDDSSPPRHPPTRTNRRAGNFFTLDSLNIPNSCVYTSRIEKLSEIKKLNIEKMMAHNDCASPPLKRQMKSADVPDTKAENIQENISIETLEQCSDRSPSPPPENIVSSSTLNRSSRQVMRKYHQVLKKMLVDKNKNKRLAESEDEGVSLENTLDKSIVVKIRWKMEILKFNIKITDKFSTIIPSLSSKLCVPFNSILLLKDDASIHPYDSPESIGLTIVDILDCLIVDPVEGSSVDDLDNITLTFQTDSKTKVAITIKKTDSLAVAIEQFAKKRNLSSACIVLKFDGEILDKNDTAEDLEFEGGECIDCIIEM